MCVSFSYLLLAESIDFAPSDYIFMVTSFSDIYPNF